MEWKAIQGYERYYEVSNTGLVRSLDRIVTEQNGKRRFLKGHMMKLSENRSKNRQGDGYLVVNLRKNHKSYVVPVHVIVARAFLENPNNYPTVNHKNGKKHDNYVSNLEWTTYGENNLHALNTGLRKPRGVQICQYSPAGVFIDSYHSVSEASRITGVSRGMISHCVNGRNNTAGRFFWKKVEKCNDYPLNGSTAEDELLREAQERFIAEDIVCSSGNAW